MKKYRQWLAEQDHMTESPDGDYYLVTEVDEQIAQIRLEKSKEFFACAKIVGELKEQIATLNEALEKCTTDAIYPQTIGAQNRIGIINKIAQQALRGGEAGNGNTRT